MKPTGWVVELAGDAFMMRLPVFEKRVASQDGQLELVDYLVPVAQVPFRVTYLSFHVHRMRDKSLLPLQVVLTSLYRDYAVARPLESFLEELRGTLPFEDTLSKRLPQGREWVAAKAAEAGFEVTRFWQYGTALHVTLGWVAPRDRARPRDNHSFHAASIEFRPTPARTLGRGKWVLPSETILAHLLAQKLRSLLKGDPQRWLSEAGHQAALEFFKWTKATLLTRAELKQARVDFVRQHPQLHSQPRELARALKNAKLYSDVTELYAIVKQLPRMLEEAEHRD